MKTVRQPRRRRARAWLALLTVAVPAVLGACGGDDDDGGGGAAFATVEHKYGTTEIPEEPERVVTVGLTDHDMVIALGVTPTAITYWYDVDGEPIWPWTREALGDEEVQILNDGAEWTGYADYNFEEIASLEPDLIIGLYIDMSQEQYDTLSEIAPTVAPSADYPEYGMPWQEATRMVGQALGKEDEAEEVIAEVDAQFAEAAEAHPEFDGKEAVVAEFWDAGKSFVRSATDPRTRFMESLGFVLPEDLAELAGDLDGADVSDEQMELLDRDVLVWNIGDSPEVRPDIEAKPLYGQLDVVRGGRTLFVEDPLISGALTWSTPLSIPYAIDELVPQLADAMAGNGSSTTG